MRSPTRWRMDCRAAAWGVALILGACATPPPKPSPLDMQRGWKIYTYAAPDALVGITTIPTAPSDAVRPDRILDSVTDAFCTPVRDEKNAAADERLKDFCWRATKQTSRVVLAPDWNAEVPSRSDCFIHCVCEGRAPRTDDPAEAARESTTGPCTNRLNCRLDCPAS